MENLALFEEKIPYTVKKLIAVNSITYCYIELEIDRHCALFGRNNVGKTSLLNALKLHFFPEISFNDCKNKFAFKSSKGELYSSEDSYSYYFPSDSSFLILEAENIHGCFCIILFKSNSSFGYQRLALPCEYAEIREHFWGINKTEVNNGLGGPVSDLGIAKIQSLFQQYQKQAAVFLKTSKEIKERLFNHSPMNKDKGRYCLVPLKDGGKERELSAFRQLMNFTFEIAKTETKGLTETFATIIESGKINVRDELHQDLQAILDEYEELRKTQDQLKAIANYSDRFKDLTEMQKNLTQQQDSFANRFSAYSLFLGEQNKNLKQKVESIEQEVIRLTDEKTRLFKLVGTQKENSSGFVGQLKELNKALKQLDKKASRFQAIQKEHSSFSIDKIEVVLKDCQEKLKDEISQSNDKQLAIETLSNNVALQNTKHKSVNEKRQAIGQQEKLLISQLGEHSAKVLSHINSRFSEIALDLKAEPRDIIEKFSTLFTIINNQLNFLGDVFSQAKLKSPQEIQAQLNKEIDDLEAEIKDLDKKIKKSHELSKLSVSDQRLNSQESSEKLDIVKKDLVIVHSIEETQSEWQVKTNEIDEIENQQKVLGKQKEETEILLEQSKGAYVIAKEQSDLLNKQIQEAQSLLQNLETLKPDKLKVTETNTASCHYSSYYSID